MRDYGPVTSPRSNPNADTDQGVDTESDVSSPALPEVADTSPSAADEAQRRERARLYPRVTSFRTRRGSLTPTQQANWERLWPSVGRDVSETERIDPVAWFGRSAPLILEIGCGTGTSTAAMAAAEPENDVIAVDVYRPGIAQLVGAIDREHLTNIRIIRGDAIIVLKNMLAPASLTGVRVFFPDPWPKARHHKRRLLQPETIALIAEVLGRRWRAAHRDRSRRVRRVDRRGPRRTVLAGPDRREGRRSPPSARSPSSRDGPPSKAARSLSSFSHGCPDEPRVVRR